MGCFFLVFKGTNLETLIKKKRFFNSYKKAKKNSRKNCVHSPMSRRITVTASKKFQKLSKNSRRNECNLSAVSAINKRAQINSMYWRMLAALSEIMYWSKPRTMIYAKQTPNATQSKYGLRGRMANFDEVYMKTKEERVTEKLFSALLISEKCV